MGKLNEAFSSRKLADMAKQHGGIEISINGGMRNGANAFHGGSSVDVSKITDEMLSGEPFKYDYKNTPDKVAANLIHFKDGYAVSLKPYDLKSDNNINPERPRQKPSRYGTGIGDTGDHNKKESPFFKNGKKDVGPEYNGFGVSSRAGESQHYREAIKNNKNDIKYYEEHPDGEYSKNAINRAKKNIQTIKGYGKELLNKRKNESKNMKKNTIKLNETSINGWNSSAYDRWKTKIPNEWDKSYMIDESDFYDMIDSVDKKQEKEFVEWLKEYSDICINSNENPFISAIDNGMSWKEIASEFFDMKPVKYYPSDIKESKITNNVKNNIVKLNESQLKKIVSESVKRVLKEYDCIEEPITDFKKLHSAIYDYVDRNYDKINSNLEKGARYEDLFEDMWFVTSSYIDPLNFGEPGNRILSMDEIKSEALTSFKHAIGVIYDELKYKMQHKNMVKLNEAQLRNLIAESVKEVINEAHVKCGLNSYYMNLFRNRIENAIRTNGDIRKEITQFYTDFRKNIMDKNFTLNNLAILAKDIENGTTNSTNITPGASTFPSAPSFGSKEDFYESKLNRIVSESIKRVLKESFIGGDNKFDDNVAQKAQSPSDVFKMNYWTGRTESKGNGELILRCYTDNNSMATRNYPDFEKVVNDLNQYYKLHGSKSIAQALPDDGVSRGRLLKITKRA